MLFGMLLGVGIWTIPFLLLGALSIRMIWLTVTRARGARPAPSCERCGYAVAGLTVFRCPECGTDLRTTGIITPAMEGRRRGGLWGALLGWTVLVVTGLYVASMFGFVFLMSAGSSAGAAGTGPMTTTVTETLTASSGTVPPIQSTVVVTPAGSGQPAWATVTLSVTDRAGRMSWIATAGGPSSSVNWSDPMGKVTAGGARIQGADVAAWLTAAGLDPTDPEVAADADELVTHLAGAWTLTTTPTGSVFTGTRFTSGGVATSAMAAGMPFAAPAGWEAYALVAAISALMIWAGGIALIVIRRKTILREYAAEMGALAVASG